MNGPAGDLTPACPRTRTIHSRQIRDVAARYTVRYFNILHFLGTKLDSTNKLTTSSVSTVLSISNSTGIADL